MKTQRNHFHIFASLLLLGQLLFLTVAAPSGSAQITPEGKFENALALYKKKDYGRALKIFQGLVEESPANAILPDALFMQGQDLRALQRWPEAAKGFSRAAEVHPTLADYSLYYQGETLQMAGEGLRSLEVFKSLIASHPGSLLVPQAELKTAEVFLNGRKVDPFRISPPRDFRILTVVFEAQIDKPFDRTDTHWSGTVGEFLVYDGKISETERAGVEEYLRRKWIASFDLERPAGASPLR